MSKYSLCESSCAIANSQWHIRKLTSKGKKLGGGIDTSSLCGHVKNGDGWDLDIEICDELFKKRYICEKCWKKMSEMYSRCK